MSKIVKRGELLYQGKKLSMYSTRDYSIFKRQKANRAKDVWEQPEENNHVAALVESMNEQLLFTLLIVNKSMEVIDGQHRLAALKLLSEEVYYIVLDDYNGDETRQYNKNAKNWGAYDYAASLAEHGDQNYKKVINYVNSNEKLSISTVIRLGTGSQDFKAFKEGSFKPDWKKLDREIELLLEFEPFNKVIMMLSKHEVAAAFQLLFQAEGYNQQYFLDKIATNISKFRPGRQYSLHGHSRLMMAKILLICYNTGLRGKKLELYPEFYNDLGKDVEI